MDFLKKPQPMFRDRQLTKAVAYCFLCRGEIYRYDESVICEGQVMHSVCRERRKDNE